MSTFDCTECASQNSTKKSRIVFVTFPLKKLLELFIKRHKNISFIENSATFPLRDTCNGKVIQRVADSLKFSRFLSLLINTDGVRIHHVTKYSIWPWLIVVNNVPAIERFKVENVIAYGFGYGANVPINQFSEVFFKEVEDINAVEGLQTEQYGKLILAVTQGTFDLPARAKFLQQIQYNGLDSCIYCYVRGIKLNSTKFSTL